MSFFYFLIFLFGISVGSFLNCLIYRLPRGKNFFTGRSSCPKCKRVLGFKDLIPILSFIILKGKCRYCHQKISLQYPLVELSTGILFVLTTYNLQLTTYNLENLFTLGYWLLVICYLLIIFVYDLKYYIIPDKIIYPAIGIVFLYRLFEILNFEFVYPTVNERSELYYGISNFGFRIPDFETLLNPLTCAILVSAFFLAIILLSRGKWLGLGDVKMAFFMGILLGFPEILVALFSAFFIGAIIGIGLILAKKKKLKSEIPFGPFLVFGTFLAMFWGNQIINWYLHLLIDRLGI